MSGSTLILFVAVLLRACGAAIRTNSDRLPARTMGWVLSTTAAWVAAGAAGAWFPVWPVLLLGVVGAFVESGANRRQLWIGADVVVVAVSGVLSIPPLPLWPLLGTVVAVAGAGFVVDSLVNRSLKPVRIATLSLLLVLAACVGNGVMAPRPVAHVRSFSQMLLRMRLIPAFRIGVAPAFGGERVVLETGAVAWLEHPAGKGPFPGALIFHGAHPNGSRQPSASILRRALLDAGFVVLSVDHPGYGESPAPSPDANVAAWDPLPTVLSAFKSLRSMRDVDRIVAFGHSMGASDVLRLLSTQPKSINGVIFGAGMPDLRKMKSNHYWYRRFHIDRRMRRRISPDLFLEIRRRFYDNSRIVQRLPSDHDPIIVVRVGFEHSNIEATRDMLYEAIPGVKAIWDLDNSTHYFNSFGIADVVLGDTHVTRLLASRFRLLADEL